MSDVILIILCTPSHLIFTTIHFRDKETKAQRKWSCLSRVTQLASVGAKIQS